MSSQKSKGFSIGYTSIMISLSEDSKAPIMEKITSELNGQHKFVIDAA
jgi:hypothetical protein